MPCLSQNNIAYYCLIHMKFISQFLLRIFLGNVSPANFPNLFICKRCVPVFFSSWSRFRVLLKGTAFLARHVKCVLSYRAEKEVRRIAARRIIAVMQNANPFRDWAEGNEPRNPAGNVGFVIQSKLPISSPSPAGSPFPAFVLRSDFNLAPKTFLLSVGEFWNNSVRSHASDIRLWLSTRRWFQPSAGALYLSPNFRMKAT